MKGFGTAICAILLFLSLTIFSVAYLVHSTILSPDFITDQVDKLEVAEIVQDAAEELIGEQLPDELEFLSGPVYEIIDEQELWLKQQANAAIYAVYDYLLGKTERLELVIPLENVKEDLKDSVWDALNKKAQEWLPEVVEEDLWPFINQHLDEFADQIPLDLLPPDVAALPDERLKPYLENYVLEIEAMIKDETEGPEVSGLLEELLRPYYDDYYDDFIGEIPDEISLTEEDIPDDVMDQLVMARKYISYFQTAYWLLIVFMVVLAALIFLIHRNVKDPSRALGIDLIIFGALDLVGVLIAKIFNPVSTILGMSDMDIPAALETWINGVVNSVFNIMMIFSIIILVVGIILLVVSIVYPRRAAEEY